MKPYKFTYITIAVVMLLSSGCEKYLDKPEEAKIITVQQTDYTIASDMIKPLLGTYSEFNRIEWEDIPLIAVRGDDVNAGGKGDQQPFEDTDNYIYSKDYWMYNSLFQNFFQNLYAVNSAMEQIAEYQKAGASQTLGDQYIAEAKVIKSWWLFQLSRVWGALPIPPTSDPQKVLITPLSSKDEIMQQISTWMDEAIPLLPNLRPNQRTDIPGGVTKYTALAMKALANLELKNYEAVSDATGQIINSGLFSLEPDFYELFKIKGKLNNENLLELQSSDLGQGSGENYAYPFAFFGPQGWTPAVTGAGDGWGFWEPSLKFIKFMLDRDEEVRLETSVLFTPKGIAKIQEDPAYANLPGWISNTTRSGDVINDYARALFASGKQYLPSDQLTPGRTDYGTNKNYPLIRYAGILLMYAEAVVQGAPATAISADEAVNLVRARAGLNPLSGVNLQQVMDEKLAELALETGERYYDMIRLQWYDQLSYDGKNFNPSEDIFLPYPQAQVDQIPSLRQ